MRGVYSVQAMPSLVAGGGGVLAGGCPGCVAPQGVGRGTSLVGFHINDCLCCVQNLLGPKCCPAQALLTLRFRQPARCSLGFQHVTFA